MSALGDLVNGKSSGSGTTSTSTPAAPLSGAAPSTPFYAGSAPSAAAAPSHHGEGIGGLLSEAGHLVANVPVALIESGATALGDIPRLVKTGEQEIHQNGLLSYNSPFNLLSGDTLSRDYLASHTTQQFGDSAKRTISDVAHPTHFVQAYQQGHLLGKVVEDLANASLVGDAIAKPLSATADAAESAAAEAQQAAEQAAKDSAQRGVEETQARQAASQGGLDPVADARVQQASTAARAAESRAEQLASAAEEAQARSERIGSLSEHLQQVQKLTNTASNPLELAGKGVKAVAGGAVDRLAGLAGSEGAVGSHLQGVADVAQRLQGVGRERAEGKLARGYVTQGGFERTRAASPILRGGEARAAILKDPTEEAASTLLHLDQRAPATAAPYLALAHAGKDDAAQSYVDRTASSLGVPAPALKLAYRALDPTEAGPGIEAARERMSQASDVYRAQQLAPTERSFLEQRGEPQPSTQLGEYRRQSLGVEPVKGDTPDERALVENAPARFRPALAAGTRAVAVVGDMAHQFREAGDEHTAALLDSIGPEVVSTLDQAVHAKLDPAFVQGGEIPEGRVSGERGLGSIRATGSRVQKDGEAQPVTIADQTRLMVQRAKRIADNETAMHIQTSLGTTAREALGEDVATMTGPEIAKAAAAEDLVAWNPASPFDRVPPGQFTADTQLIPKSIYNTYQSHLDDRSFSPDNLGWHGARGAVHGLVKANDVAMRGFKAGALYLSPRWVVGHVIGHAILSTFGAGLSPAEFLSGIARAREVAHGDLSKLDPAQRSLIDEHGNVPGELVGRGQASIDERQQSRLTPGGLQRPSLAHPIAMSQHAVAFTDDIGRVATALAKAKQATADDLAGFRAEHPELAGTPDSQVVKEYAIRQSLKALGDYTDLTGMEREVLGRLVLFYPWIKHMTRLADQLAVHNPLRIAWALHLSDLYGGGGQTPLTAGKVPLGNQWYLTLPKTDPFSHIFSNYGATGTGETPFAALSPVIQTGLAGLGLNIGKGQLLQEAPGFGPTDSEARPAAGPIGLRPFANYLLGEQPQLSAATTIIPSLLGHAPVARYATGQPVRIGHQDISDAERLAPFSGGGAFAPLLSMLGIPVASQIDEKSLLARIAARRKQLAGARASYNAVLPGRAP